MPHGAGRGRDGPWLSRVRTQPLPGSRRAAATGAVFGREQSSWAGAAGILAVPMEWRGRRAVSIQAASRESPWADGRDLGLPHKAGRTPPGRGHPRGPLSRKSLRAGRPSASRAAPRDGPRPSSGGGRKPGQRRAAPGWSCARRAVEAFLELLRILGYRVAPRGGSVTSTDESGPILGQSPHAASLVVTRCRYPDCSWPFRVRSTLGLPPRRTRGRSPRRSRGHRWRRGRRAFQARGGYAR